MIITLERQITLIYESKKTKESKREKVKICCGHLCQREIIVSFNKLHYLETRHFKDKDTL